MVVSKPLKAAIFGVALAGTISVSQESRAQDSWSDGLYLKAIGGFSFQRDFDVDVSDGDGNSTSGDASFDVGFMAGAGLGYFFTDSIAVELAWDYRSNDLDSADLDNGSEFDGGDIASNIIFLNGYYRFQEVGSTSLRPYVGAGLGWVEEIDIDADVAGGRSTSYSADNELAYQIMAGIGYPLSENWTLSGELRYTRVNDVTFDEEGSGNGEIDNVDYDPISLLVGITYNF